MRHLAAAVGPFAVARVCLSPSCVRRSALALECIALQKELDALNASPAAPSGALARSAERPVNSSSSAAAAAGAAAAAAAAGSAPAPNSTSSSSSQPGSAVESVARRRAALAAVSVVAHRAGAPAVGGQERALKLVALGLDDSSVAIQRAAKRSQRCQAAKACRLRPARLHSSSTVGACEAMFRHPTALRC